MEDLKGLSLRELLTLARERLGASASALKTREELIAALTVEAPDPVHPEEGRGAMSEPIVTRDFFRRREE
ncbi:MAG: hypothetical protein Q8L48_00990 [Archangium sp.]|nr:hypothetical protein [Archangium sp.]